MQRDKLIATQRKLCIGLPLIIAELDFINVRRENFDHSADLTAL